MSKISKLEEVREQIYEEVFEHIERVLPTVVMEKLSYIMADIDCPCDNSDYIDVTAKNIAQELAEKIRYKFD